MICHRSTWQMGTALSSQWTLITGLDNLPNVFCTTYKLCTMQGCPLEWSEVLAQGALLGVQLSPGWQLAPAPCPRGESQTFRRRKRKRRKRGVSVICLIPHVAATPAAGKASLPGNWIANNCKSLLLWVYTTACGRVICLVGCFFPWLNQVQ